MPVEVNRASLKRVWRQTDYQEIPFVLEPSDPRTDAFAMFEGARLVANEASVSEFGPDDSAFVEAASETPRGVAAFMTGTGAEAAVWQWFNDFATKLESDGMTGTLVAARQDRGPAWVRSPETAGLAHTLFLQFTPLVGTSRGLYPLGSLDLDPVALDQIADIAATWASLSGASTRTFLIRRMFQSEISTDHLAEQLRGSALRHGGSLAMSVDTAAREMRSAALDARARAILSVAAPEGSWEASVSLLRAATLQLGESPGLEHAFIRRTNPRPLGWAHVNHPTPAPACGNAARFNSELVLQRTYVPDAYGVQVLTDAHLERTHDLSAWEVRPLGNGRNLVTHPDQEGWFAGNEPDPALLQQARQDFGDLILPPRA